MRDRSKTIEALRNLAERPGTPEEGATARRLLEMFGGVEWVPLPFIPSDFPPGSVVFYCHWCSRNERATVRSKPPRWIQGQWWMLLKLDRLKQAGWYPVTSNLGCHLGKEPFAGNVEETLYRMDVDWALKDAEFRKQCAAHGISLRPWNEPVPQIA